MHLGVLQVCSLKGLKNKGFESLAAEVLDSPRQEAGATLGRCFAPGAIPGSVAILAQGVEAPVHEEKGDSPDSIAQGANGSSPKTTFYFLWDKDLLQKT